MTLIITNTNPSSEIPPEEGGGGAEQEDMGHIRGPYAYKKMETDDPEERRRRRAQFLIYRALERADAKVRRSSRPAFLGLRVCKLTVKVGKRLRRSRKRVTSMISKARNAAASKRILKQLRDLESLPYFFLHVEEIPRV